MKILPVTAFLIKLQNYENKNLVLNTNIQKSYFKLHFKFLVKPNISFGEMKYFLISQNK